VPAEVGRAGADSEQQLEACRRELAEARPLRFWRSSAPRRASFGQCWRSSSQPNLQAKDQELAVHPTGQIRPPDARGRREGGYPGRFRNGYGSLLAL